MSPQQATAMQPAKGSVPIRRGGPTNLLEDFENVYNSIARRAFELFEANGCWPGREWENWFRAEAEMLHPLHLEVRENDGGFSIQAEVPGFTPKEIEITVEPRCLKIAGKRERKEEEKKGRTIRSEWCADQVFRSIDLPVDVDSSKASANLKDGVLSIELPKAAHAKAVRIEPKSA